MELLTKGTEIYYGGDRCNDSGFGVIVEVIQDKSWGDFYEIDLEDGRKIRRLPVSMFSEKYLGHHGTNFVTKAVYQAYYDAAMAGFKARYTAKEI